VNKTTHEIHLNTVSAPDDMFIRDKKAKALC
jgi:hypothetical protein